VHSMNSGLVEAHELAERISRIQRGEGSPSLLEEFATGTRDAWQWLVGAGRSVRALPGAAGAPAARLARGGGGHPWVLQNAARIVACMPASGDDLEALLAQIGLTLGSREA